MVPRFLTSSTFLSRISPCTQAIPTFTVKDKPREGGFFPSLPAVADLSMQPSLWLVRLGRGPTNAGYGDAPAGKPPLA
jgi:hypothetical protein